MWVVRSQAKTSSREMLAQQLPSSAARVSNIPNAPGIGHNGGPDLSDADLISEVLARGLQSAVAAQLPASIVDHAARLGGSRLRPLGPLAVSVRTAAEMLGVGISTIWLLIKQQQLEVIRPGRRTLPTMASLEAFVELASTRSHLPQQMTSTPIAEDRPPIHQKFHSGKLEGKTKVRRPRSTSNGTRAESDPESDR
jgi:excisionase family DNA binding protein